MSRHQVADGGNCLQKMSVAAHVPNMYRFEQTTLGGPPVLQLLTVNESFLHGLQSHADSLKNFWSRKAPSSIRRIQSFETV